MSRPPDWKAFRALFPVTRRLTYLNSAAIGPLPDPVRAALEAHMDAWQGEDLGTRIGVDFSEPLRAKAARFIGASPEEIAFTGGVTDGLFRVTSLVRPSPGQNVVLPANEFPSSVYPWRAFEPDGVEVRFAGPAEGPVTEEHLQEACDGATATVCASLVSFADGTRLDLPALSRFCRPRGIALVVDAMQAAGAIAIDVASAGADFLVFGPVKWLPAPVGAGILYVRRGWEARDGRRWLGWRSVERDGLGELLRYDLPPWRTARRLDGGSPAVMSHVGLEAVLDLFLGIGPAEIERRIGELSAGVLRIAGEAGFGRCGPVPVQRRAGIVVFDAPDASGLVERLAGAGVIVAERNGRVRVSAHAFNDEEDLETLRRRLRGPGAA